MKFDTWKELSRYYIVTILKKGYEQGLISAYWRNDCCTEIGMIAGNIRILCKSLEGQVTLICVSKLTIIGSDNGLAPVRLQAIIWTNVGILLIGPLGDFSEILIEIHTFSFKKMYLKMSSGKWRPFCLGLNVLIVIYWCLVPHNLDNILLTFNTPIKNKMSLKRSVL